MVVTLFVPEFVEKTPETPEEMAVYANAASSYRFNRTRARLAPS